MRHAFLIIAHTDFDMLQQLVSALDCNDTDIFVHIDARSSMPCNGMETKHSRLFFLTNRIDVRWGTVAQIECQFLLWEEALKFNHYDYYHIISGNHFPLMDRDDLNSFFDSHSGESILCPLPSNREEIVSKLGYYNLFLDRLIDRNAFINKMSHFLWKVANKLQPAVFRRDITMFHQKVNNWCVLTEDAVRILVEHKKEILRRMNMTFCGDEFFVPAYLNKYNQSYSLDTRLLYCKFDPYTPIELTHKEVFDESAIKRFAFGRKFSSKNAPLLVDIKRKLYYD